MSLRAAVMVVCALGGLAAPAYATDYYVSPSGNDAAVGTSVSTPWQTIARVNQATLASGDRVFFQAGATFNGNLLLDAGDGGTPTAPVTFASYGTGHASITASSGTALFIYNRAAVQVSSLDFRGADAPGSNGIAVYSDLAGATPLPFVRIDDVEVSGFGQDGIQIGAWGGAAGFADIRITRSLIHDNDRTGILTYADRPNVHRNVYIGYTKAYSNPGLASATTNTGSGIVLGSVDGGTVERSVAHDNGARSTTSEGPVGIWAYDSAHIVIQHNESYRNHTGGPADGGGFDLDQNVSDSTVQFNYSHDNDGAGYLLAQAYATDTHHGNIVRFNISQDDGRKNGYGGIEIWGRTIDAAIDHNTVVTSAATSGTPAAIRIHNAGVAGVRAQGVRVVNNIFYTSGPALLARVTSDQLVAAPVLFAGNSYYGASAFTIAWGASTLSSLVAFRNVGQEQVSGIAVGLSGDPGLRAAGTGGTLDDATRLESLEVYRPGDASNVRDRGLALSTFGLAAAPVDYFGTSLAGVVPDVGAGEFVAAPLTIAPDPTPTDIVIRAADGPYLHGNWAIVDDASAAGLARVQNPDKGAAKIATPLATPADYFEQTFTAQAGIAYRLWIRAIAERNSYANDSAYVQFSGTIDESGAPAWRIGTTSATAYVLENCSGCGVSGWGWQDNGYGLSVLGPAVAFAASGSQTIRIQAREDGIGIDQIVLSPITYQTTAPGATKNDATILGAPTTAPPSDSTSTGTTAPPPDPTASTEPPATTTDPLEVVLWAADNPRLAGNWVVTPDASAAGGARVSNPDHNAAKLASALAVPANVLELTFTAQAGVPYRLWLRGAAEKNSYNNDSVFVQFSGSVDAAGTPIYRTGTTSATVVVLEDGSGCGVSGWGWQDNGYGVNVLGPVIYFATSGPQTIRIQLREDGLSIDQVVLSASNWITKAPGAVRSDTTILTR
jgi:hypothetical protein